MDTAKYHSSDSCIYTRACGTRVNTCYQTRDISLYQCCNIIINIHTVLGLKIKFPSNGVWSTLNYQTMHSTLIKVEPKLAVDTLLCPKFIAFDLEASHMEKGWS